LRPLNHVVDRDQKRLDRSQRRARCRNFHLHRLDDGNVVARLDDGADSERQRADAARQLGLNLHFPHRSPLLADPGGAACDEARYNRYSIARTKSTRRAAPPREECNWKPELDELMRREGREMGGTDKVKRQHEGGRLTVRERIALLVDPGSFHEVGAISA
jgi:hypothetical protein